MNRFFDKIPYFQRYNIPGKIVLSFLMFLYAIIKFWVTFRLDTLICSIAMFLAFAGDRSMNKNSIEKRTHNEFVNGVIFFAFAHVLYAISYYVKTYANNNVIINPGFYTIEILYIALVITFNFILNSKKSKVIDYLGEKSLILGIAYSFILFANCAIICSYSYSAGGIEYLAGIGAILFLVSDVFIGIETFFKVRSKVIRELVWWFYPIGQILIITFA